MIVQNGQRSMNEHMKDRIELIYDEAYDFIDQALTKIRALDKNDLQTENEEVQEKAERTEFALQAARDILENMIIPGKKLTFIYEKGSVVVKFPIKNKNDFLLWKSFLFWQCKVLINGCITFSILPGCHIGCFAKYFC